MCRGGEKRTIEYAKNIKILEFFCKLNKKNPPGIIGRISEFIKNIFYQAILPIFLKNEACEAMAERIFGNSMYLMLKSSQVCFMILLIAG